MSSLKKRKYVFCISLSRHFLFVEHPANCRVFSWFFFRGKRKSSNEKNSAWTETTKAKRNYGSSHTIEDRRAQNKLGSYSWGLSITPERKWPQVQLFSLFHVFQFALWTCRFYDRISTEFRFFVFYNIHAVAESRFWNMAVSPKLLAYKRCDFL